MGEGIATNGGGRGGRGKRERGQQGGQPKGGGGIGYEWRRVQMLKAVASSALVWVIKGHVSGVRLGRKGQVDWGRSGHVRQFFGWDWVKIELHRRGLGLGLVRSVVRLCELYVHMHTHASTHARTGRKIRLNDKLYRQF